MSVQPLETPGDGPGPKPPPPASLQRSVRRTMLSTGFSDVPGKTCEICGFQAFRWQTTCPEGHPLA